MPLNRNKVILGIDRLRHEPVQSFEITITIVACLIQIDEAPI